MKLIYAHAGWAPHAAALLARAAAQLAQQRAHSPVPSSTLLHYPTDSLASAPLQGASLAAIYEDCLQRLRIRQRYPTPDWSIADLWVARALLRTGTAPATVAAVLRHGSPGFPRRHADPDDYLRRTLRRAAVFSRAARPPAFD